MLRWMYGTHMPLLMRVMEIAPPGPVVEFGCGMWSTLYLHWECYRKGRHLVTYEGRPEFAAHVGCLASPEHEIITIGDDWDSADASQPWAVAFVDHEPAPRRGIELRRLTHAQYVVAHDTNRHLDFYGYQSIAECYKYHFKYTALRPHTTVMSNFHDCSRIME